MKPEEILAALDACRKATKGPWTRPKDLRGRGTVASLSWQEDAENSRWLFNRTHQSLKIEDADFIALARTALPAALALIGDLLDVIEAGINAGEHAAMCATHRLRTASMIESGEWFKCTCGLGPASTGAAAFTTDAWRTLAAALRSAKT